MMDIEKGHLSLCMFVCAKHRVAVKLPQVALLLCLYVRSIHARCSKGGGGVTLLGRGCGGAYD